jgi:hypothetical protein
MLTSMQARDRLRDADIDCLLMIQIPRRIEVQLAPKFPKR